MVERKKLYTAQESEELVLVTIEKGRASLGRDIQTVTGLSPNIVRLALAKLIFKGCIKRNAKTNELEFKNRPFKTCNIPYDKTFKTKFANNQNPFL